MGNAASTSKKGKAKQESLERLPQDIQEALILEDLLFVLTVCSHPQKEAIITLTADYTNF